VIAITAIRHLVIVLAYFELDTALRPCTSHDQEDTISTARRCPIFHDNMSVFWILQIDGPWRLIENQSQQSNGHDETSSSEGVESNKVGVAARSEQKTSLSKIRIFQIGPGPPGVVAALIRLLSKSLSLAVLVLHQILFTQFERFEFLTMKSFVQNVPPRQLYSTRLLHWKTSHHVRYFAVTGFLSNAKGHQSVISRIPTCCREKIGHRRAVLIVSSWS